MSAHPHPTTFPSPRQRATVLGLAVLLLALTPAADAARSTRTVSGIPITADWQRSGSAWTASGAADVGGMSLSDASLRLSGNQLTGSVDGLDVELFAGCSLQSASADIGLATGSTVRQDVSDAPVQDHQTYLYFDHSGGTELECAGLAMPLAGGSSQRLFINPSDPSIYVQASDVFSGSSQSSLAGATRKIAGVDIGEATIGLSSGGLVPWQASERDAGGKRESFDAHLVIGGDVEIKAGKVRVAVREGTQAYRFNSKLDGIEKTCTSGSLVIPAFSAPMIGDVDLPLGKGVACLKGSKIEISTTIGGNAWASVEALPKTIRDALGQLGTGDRSLGGSIDADTGRVELEIGGTYPVGPWNVQGALAVGSSGFQMKGKTDFKTGPLDFGGMKTTVQFLPEPRPARPRASDSPRPPSSCGRWRPRSWTTRKSTGSRPTSRSDDTSLGDDTITPPRLSQPPHFDPLHHLWCIALSLPAAKQSIRFGPQETQLGDDMITPPRLSQPPHFDPFHHLWCIALSLPLAKQSIRFGPQETQLGDDTITPPRLSQPPHFDPFHHLWCIALSLPAAKQSTRFGPQETQLGDDMITPPRLSHPPHAAPAALGTSASIRITRIGLQNVGSTNSRIMANLLYFLAPDDFQAA